jgi:hypothetical protein
MRHFIKTFIAVGLVFWAIFFAARYYWGSAELVLPMMFTAAFFLFIAVSLIMGCVRAVIWIKNKIVRTARR